LQRLDGRDAAAMVWRPLTRRCEPSDAVAGRRHQGSRRRHFAYGARKEAGNLASKLAAGAYPRPGGSRAHASATAWRARGRWVEPNNNNTKWWGTAKACAWTSPSSRLVSARPQPPNNSTAAQLSLPSSRLRLPPPPPPPPIRAALTSDQSNLAGGRTSSSRSAGGSGHPHLRPSPGIKWGR
jgi:hypothetical protein